MNTFTKSRKVILVAITRETISSRDYLEISQSNPATIKTATFVPPKIGSNSFGSFDVEYRDPKLVPCI